MRRLCPKGKAVDFHYLCAHFLEATAIRLAAEELYANTNSCTLVSTVE